MALSDKSLTCVECASEFSFTVGEQEFFASRGYTNEPKRCTQCRGARKSQQGGYGNSYGSSDREMHPAVCASVAKTRRSPSDPVVTDRCIAAIALAE